jgi:DNA-binding response OmpR family regulator
MPDTLDRRRILVVDDEERMVRFIRMNLEHDGFQVSEAFNGKQAIQRIRDVTPDLILLDVMMPDIDGFEVLETIREFSNVPVIMLTAKGEEDDRVRGLENGADDYITKPFSPRELVSRAKAVLRRTEGATGSMHGLLEVDKRLKIDFDRREIWLEGKLVKLRPTEYRLLFILCKMPAGWFLTISCSKKFGAMNIGTSRITSAFISTTCARNWRKTPPTPVHSHRARRWLSLRGFQTQQGIIHV